MDRNAVFNKVKEYILMQLPIDDSRVVESAREGDVLLGCNFWAWSGLARQTPGHDFWQEGDDLCGDPFQEAQGLNGVYLTDSSTMAVIDACTAALQKINNDKKE